jgi:hypothetical protein
MIDRLTVELGTVEFLRQLLGIAQESDHPMDKAADHGTLEWVVCGVSFTYALVIGRFLRKAFTFGFSKMS